jgi:hypothetical protein
MKQFLLLTAAACLLVPATILAADYNDGDACSAVNTFQWTNDASDVTYLMCNGTLWKEALTISSGRSFSFKGFTGAAYALNIWNTHNGTSVGSALTFMTASSLRRAQIIGRAGGSSTTGQMEFLTRTAGTTTEKMRLTTEGYLGIGDTAPSAALDVVGDIHYTGVIVDVSDARLKTKIHRIDNALSGIRELKGVSFVMKDDPDKNTELGLIAQDVQKVFPALVIDTGEGALSLNYQGMMGPMVEAIKELDVENRRLRTTVQSLDARLKNLEAKR